MIRSRALILILLSGMVALLMHAACGGTSGAAPTVPATMPVSIEEIDGAGSEVEVGSSFKYVFNKAVDESTVTEETFFMHPVIEAEESLSPKALYDATVCDVSQAIASTVSCSSSTECVLDPASDLVAAELYVICLVPGSTEVGISSVNALSLKATGTRVGIFYLDGPPMLGDLILVATTGYNAANEIACDTSSDCASTHYCFFSTCLSKTELGLTYSDCELAADCATGEVCQTNVDARSCDTGICLDGTTFAAAEGYISTESECGDPLTTGYYWDDEMGECYPADVVVCDEAGDGGFEPAIGGAFDIDVDTVSDPNQVLMAAAGGSDSLFFYYGTYDEVQQGVINWDYDGRQELDLSAEGLCTDCLDIEDVKVDYIGSDSWMVMFTVPETEGSMAKVIYVTRLDYNGSVLAASTPVRVNDDAADGAQYVRYADMAQYGTENISVFAFLADSGPNNDMVFYDECDYSGADIVCGNDQQIAELNSTNDEGDAVAITVLRTAVFVAFSDVDDVEVIQGDLTFDPARFALPKRDVFDNSSGGTHSLAMTVDSRGTRYRVDIIALSHYNVGGGPYQLRHAGGTLAGTFTDFNANVTVLNANVDSPAGFVDAYQFGNHVGVLYSQADGEGNMILWEHWMYWAGVAGTPDDEEGEVVLNVPGTEHTYGRLFRSDSEWFLFWLMSDTTQINYTHARDNVLVTRPIVGDWPDTPDIFPGQAE